MGCYGNIEENMNKILNISAELNKFEEIKKIK